MHTEPLPTYLRLYRRRLGLSATELGILCGDTDGSSISRYEKGVNRPPVEVVMATELVLGVPATELFAGYTEAARLTMAAGARRLLAKLENEDMDSIPLAKVALLRRLAALHAAPREGDE